MAQSETRLALRCASANGFLWAIGNGLATTSLVIYLALQLGANDLHISLILAAAPLVGLLRQFAPLIVGRVIARKTFCIRCYLASCVALSLLPILSQPDFLPAKWISMAVLVSLWSVYHLLEYLGTVALWSWLGDAAPASIRGRFLGVRERYLTGGRILGMLIASGVTSWWREAFPFEYRWLGFAVVAICGAAVMAAATFPLAKMPSFEARNDKSHLRFVTALWRLIQPLKDGPFARLVLFGSWLGVSAGLTQTAQYKYPINVLGISLSVYLAARSGMFLAQSLSGPWVGNWIDRFGSKRLMLLSTLIVATGPLFFFMATPEHWQWYLLAWVVWVWFVVLNIGLYYLILKFSGAGRRTEYVATYETCTGFAYGAGALAGGLLTEYLSTLPSAFCFSLSPQSGVPALLSVRLDVYAYLFLAGWLLRSAAALILMTVREPSEERVGARVG